MIRRSHIIGLVFFALALCFAVSPTDFISSAAAQMELQDGGVENGGGGKAAGDPDMPDTQPPPPGPSSASGWSGYGFSGTGSIGSAPDGGMASGSGLNANLTLRVWLRTAWRALRLQYGW